MDLTATEFKAQYLNALSRTEVRMPLKLLWASALQLRL